MRASRTLIFRGDIRYNPTGTTRHPKSFLIRFSSAWQDSALTFHNTDNSSRLCGYTAISSNRHAYCKINSATKTEQNKTSIPRLLAGSTNQHIAPNMDRTIVVQFVCDILWWDWSDLELSHKFPILAPFSVNRIPEYYFTSSIGKMVSVIKDFDNLSPLQKRGWLFRALNTRVSLGRRS